jgi:predicted RNA methylase
MTTNQIKGLSRNPIDKFYTDILYANKCVNYIKKYVEIAKDDLIIEPSAGNGSFMECIKSLNTDCKFYDIEPENEEIIKQDYLLLDTSNFEKKVHIIGNPPFGRQASLAIKFIKKSCEFAESISFILPKSFKKDSMRNKFNENFHLMFEEDVPLNSFIVNGKMYDVPCVFQIWKKQTSPRDKIEKLTPQHFEFVKIDEKPDISFRRVGVYAGKIDTDTEKSEQSHYFIKFTNNKSIKINLEKLKSITFDFNNTVGPRSISKQELIKEFDRVL